MKIKNLSISLVLLFIVSCQPDSDARKTRKSGQGSSANSVPNLFTTTTPTYNPTPVEDNPYDSDDTDTFLSIPNGAATCTWSRDGMADWQYKGAHLSSGENDLNDGMYNICISSSDPTTIYFQMKHPPNDHQVCFVPTIHSGSLKTYIGEPRCESVTTSQKIYTLKLYANRPGYTSSIFTGVMIMRDKAYFYAPPFNQLILSPDAFIYCNQWLAAYNDSSYCESFASGGHYEYHQFSRTGL